ncbi:hypothetical protein HOY82DRAFT_536663 [Tuber indicum]|nr:hypothetical protein HOY82DRAFT_536663 [Tuber indicum]
MDGSVTLPELWVPISNIRNRKYEYQIPFSSGRLAVRWALPDGVSSAVLFLSLHTDANWAPPPPPRKVNKRPTIMARNSAKGISEGYTPSNTDTANTSYSGNERTTPPSSNTSPTLLGALPDSTPANLTPPALSCPVSVCSLVFKGQMPQGYLWRHLNHPGIYGRTGSEKDTWLHLHKVELDRLLATRVTPAQRKREANRLKAQKMLRSAEFGLRARDMGITERVLVDEKVAIWEGMWAAEQNGDIIDVGILYTIPFSTF